MATRPLDYRFFRGHYGALTAFHLMRAEEAMVARDWRVRWEDDPEGDLGDHALWCDGANRGECPGHEVLCAVMTDAEGNVLSSLGSIIDADIAYGRVVVAELALEALQDVTAREASTIRDIAAELTAIRNVADDGCDVRLQVHSDGHWAVRFGDAGYDTDHHGFWGASEVPPKGEDFDAEEMARDLYAQAMDHKAEGNV